MSTSARNHVFASPDSLVPLRAELERITSLHLEDRVGLQITAIERLRRQFPHSIELSAAVANAIPCEGQYTCFMHALALHPLSSLAASIMKRFDNVYPSAEFVSLLVTGELLVPVNGPAQDSHIVIYYDGERPRHAGKWEGDRVLSKWGLGHLWRHPLFEVPSSYGNTVRQFRPVQALAAEQWFLTYAASRIGTEVINDLRAAIRTAP